MFKKSTYDWLYNLPYEVLMMKGSKGYHKKNFDLDVRVVFDVWTFA